MDSKHPGGARLYAASVVLDEARTRWSPRWNSTTLAEVSTASGARRLTELESHIDCFFYVFPTALMCLDGLGPGVVEGRLRNGGSGVSRSPYRR